MLLDTITNDLVYELLARSENHVYAATRTEECSVDYGQIYSV